MIRKAQKGSREAMRYLYEENKNRVFFLCRLLLDDENAACNATSRIFKNMWDSLLAGEIKTEREFSFAVFQRAVLYCRTALIKKDNKAFRLPKNKNFSIVDLSSFDKIKEDDIHLRAIKGLPCLHRFIYVLKEVFEYSTQELARVLMIGEDIAQLALSAEESNIKRLIALMEKQAEEECPTSAEQFFFELGDLRRELDIPSKVDKTVKIGIDAVCAPILAKAKRKRKKALLIALAIVIGTAVLTLGIWGAVAAIEAGAAPEETEGEYEDDYYDDYEDITYTSEYTATHYADIEIKDYGKITVALDGNMAPETVENFVSLANEGFYDGLTFHRIKDGFMMQGGDPKADGTGGNTDEDGNEINVAGEFYYNGSSNNLSHTRGAISMARGDDYDSGSSQFFIVHEDSSASLDGLYAVFGYVTEGMDIVDAICTSAEPIDDNYMIAEEDQPVITSITIRSVADDTEAEATDEETEAEETETE